MGIRGVFSQTNNKLHFLIKINKYMVVYLMIKKAAKKYNELATEYFKNFARLNKI